MRLLFLILFTFVAAGCATQSHLSDTAADEKLGLVQEEKKDEAQEALSQLQELHRQEQKRNLERQITDPLSPSNR